jgi:hypothetical protein
MKTLILFFIFAVCLISCEKNDDTNLIYSEKNDEVDKPQVEIRNPFIEEYVYDSGGVVFKITNDIDSLINNRTQTLQLIDSLAFKKLHYRNTIDSINNKDVYTWMKKGDYVCWRYKYIFDGPINSTNSRYFISTVIDNPLSTTITDKYCEYSISLYYYQIDTEKYDYKNIFPYPVNDTVYVNISSIFKQHFSRYIN